MRELSAVVHTVQCTRRTGSGFDRNSTQRTRRGRQSIAQKSSPDCHCLIRPSVVWHRASMHRCILPLARRLRFHSALADNVASGDYRWPGWQVVVGIEVHAQIKSRKKLFSGKDCTLWLYSCFLSPSPSLPSCSESWTNDPPQPPSTRFSAFDASFPGTLPVRTSDAFQFTSRSCSDL